MLRAISTLIHIKKRLHPGLLDAMAQGGAQGIEVFAAREHFNYHEKEHVKEIGNWFKSGQVEFHSLHSPIYPSSDFRSGSPALNIVDMDKRQRIEAMDEIKRAIEVAEYVPFRFMIQHIGRTDEADDPRKFEAALSSIEHLRAFARPLGVTLLIENTRSDLATPEKIKELLKALHYPDLGVCFDTGHAHMMSSVHQAFDMLADRIRSTHVHDNRRDRDSHVWPGEGNIDWNQTMQSLRTAPNAPALLLEIEDYQGTDVAKKMTEAYGMLESAAVEAQ
ncbi:MAG TPA: sugar phosphate isomerase/epimerase family protein [Candidatus Angelobacter sp.]|nr:sugar phosphate isomerase/epimerase family protein [Candidatus Angelobacter sp.]